MIKDNLVIDDQYPPRHYRSRAKRFRAGGAILALLASAAFGQPALALQPGEQAHLVAVGPTDPATNFPVWYQDQNGLTLQLCTANNDPLNLCIFDPPDPTNEATFAYQQQIGFASEAFWWSADASLPIAPSPECPTCSGARIVLGLEAAFGTADAIRGNEFSFGRVRMRIDAPAAGRYKITYPFGVQTIKVDAPGVKAINVTNDIGTFSPDYSGPLKSDIGAFLKWDPAVPPSPPAGYIGDPNVPHPVVGATYYDPVTNQPFNKIRIEYLDGPINLDGLGHNFVETSDFSVSGLVFNGVTPTPLSLVRSTYSDGRAEVVAEAPSSASVSVSFDDGATSQPLIGDDTGNFYIAAPVSAPPAIARVTASNAGNSATTLNGTVTDVVWITAAQYDPSTRTLSLKASSSNAAATPVLTAVGFGNRSFGVLDSSGSLTVANVPTAPAWVQVNSSLGGTAREAVRILSASPAWANDTTTTGTTPGTNTPANQAPVAQNDTATASLQTPVVIDVAANDFDPDGTLNLASIAIVAQPLQGTIGPIGAAGITYTPNAGFASGLDTFTYTIADNAGATSNVASVTVSVIPAQLSIDRVEFDRQKSQWDIRGSTNATANTTISAYLGSQFAPSSLIGSAPVQSNGSFQILVPGSPLVPTSSSTVSVTNGQGTIIAGVRVAIK